MTTTSPMTTTTSHHDLGGTDMKTNVLLTAATWATGLVAGLFVAFAIAVMPALHGASAHVFVDTMQRINVSIQNPIFLLLFLGGPIVLAIAAYQYRQAPGRAWVFAGLALTVVALIVTFAINIPLNDQLANAGSHHAAAARAAFENKWNVANVVRTILMAASFAALVVGERTNALVGS